MMCRIFFVAESVKAPSLERMCFSVIVSNILIHSQTIMVMKILVGTENQRKIIAVETVVKSMNSDVEYLIKGCSAESVCLTLHIIVRQKMGALNRARNAKKDGR